MSFRRQSRIRHILAMFASAAALIFSAWLASIPGQAEENTPNEGDTQRKPVTCTDVAGIIYDRGLPGFERCLQEMNQAAQAESQEQVLRHGGKSDQAGTTSKKSSRKSRKGPRPTDTPTPLPTVAPDAVETE
jgi:hypothetical protein